MFNRVTIIGNMCKDPELRKTGAGKSVCNITVAVNGRKGAADETLFIGVTLWEKNADIVKDYGAKGKRVLIDGRLFNDVFKKQDGTETTKLAIVASSVRFLDKSESAAPTEISDVEPF